MDDLLTSPIALRLAFTCPAPCPTSQSCSTNLPTSPAPAVCDTHLQKWRREELVFKPGEPGSCGRKWAAGDAALIGSDQLFGVSATERWGGGVTIVINTEETKVVFEGELGAVVAGPHSGSSGCCVCVRRFDAYFGVVVVANLPLRVMCNAGCVSVLSLLAPNPCHCPPPLLQTFSTQLLLGCAIAAETDREVGTGLG